MTVATAMQRPFKRGDVVRSGILGAIGRVVRAGRATAKVRWTNGTDSTVMQQCSTHLVEVLDPSTPYGASVSSYVDACLRGEA